MDDIREYIKNERGRFKLEVWETSKAPELGFCKYCVYVWAAVHSSVYEPGNAPLVGYMLTNDGRTITEWLAASTQTPALPAPNGPR